MEIHTLSALELKASLDQGDLSSEEIVRALIERSETVDGIVGAFVHRFFEQALDDARRADDARAKDQPLGALHGIPITIKENLDTVGVPSSLGIQARLKTPATEDAVVVRLAKKAGAIILGKTNVPQTLLSPMETENRIWGRTSNPWSRSHAVGGSSGGEAAALASGQSPLGVGTDIGGSVRLPAHFCGVVGLKPTFGRWSTVGMNAPIRGQETIRSKTGPMARTVADVSFFLRALDSPQHSVFDPSVPPLPIGDPNAVKVSELRVGFYDHDGFFSVSPAVNRAMTEARESLEGAGVTVVTLSPPSTEELVLTMYAVLSADGGAMLDSALAGEKILPSLALTRRIARLDPRVRAGVIRAALLLGEHRLGKIMGQLGKKSAEQLWHLTSRREELRREELALWRRHKIDGLLCPMHPTAAVPHGEGRDFTPSVSYAARFNVLDLPAGSVPVTLTRADETVWPDVADRLDKRAASVTARSANLPVGVQVAGLPYREDVVLALMRVIEDGARKSRDFPWTPVDPH